MVLAQRHPDSILQTHKRRRHSRLGRPQQLTFKPAAAPVDRRPLQTAPSSSRMDSAPATLRCNGCWNDLPPRSQCVAAPCAHLFCECKPKCFKASNVHQQAVPAGMECSAPGGLHAASPASLPSLLRSPSAAPGDDGRAWSGLLLHAHAAGSLGSMRHFPSNTGPHGMVWCCCHHNTGTDCAERIVLSDNSCPICQHVISKSNVKLVKVLQENPSQQLGLYGQTPEVVLNTALQAISCYVLQQKLQSDYREAQLTRKVAKVQEACRKKLEEVHNGYQLAKRKYQEAVQDKRALEQEIQELRQKYEEKARAARQLQQSMDQMQQENRLMRHGNATSGGSGGVARGGGNVFGSGGLGSGGLGGGGGGGFGNHRGISPAGGGLGHHGGGGGAQVVTTMQRTRVFANMTNSPQMGGTFGGLPNRNTGMLGHRPGSGGPLGGGLDASSPMAPLGRRASGVFEPPALQQHQQQQGGSGATLRRLLVGNNHGGGAGAGGGGGGGGGRLQRPFGSLGSPSGLVSL